MLEAKDVSVLYGRHRALENVSVRVNRGEICIVLGPDGAGKSTLLKAIAGLIRCQTGGRVSVNGADITSAKPGRIVEHGVALVPEGGAIFGDLTVAENLQLGAFPSRARKHEAANVKRVYELFPMLSKRRGQIARTMPGGEQRMLAIGRALMSNPEILMLDEPSLGLSPHLSTELFKALKEIAASGVGILLAEQNVNQSLEIADRSHLLENGRIVSEESAVAVANNPAVDAGVNAGTVQLPPALPLAGKSAAEIGEMAGELAPRAAAVHAAYVECQRGAAPQGASRAERDATPAPAAPSISVSSDAGELSRLAGALAERASGMHAAHIRSLREQEPADPPATAVSSKPMPEHVAPPERDGPALTRMAAGLAKRAEESGRSLNSGEARGAVEAPISPRRGNGAWPADQACAISASAAELAARAAALHASYVAASRTAGATPHAFLTAGSPGDAYIAAERPKKHKYDKKKSKKSRKRHGKSKGD